MGTVLGNVRPVMGNDHLIHLRLEGKVFAEISEQDLPPRPEDTVVDGNGKLAIPGFVNAHTHLPMVLFRGLADDVPLRVWLEEHVWPLERRLRPKDVYWCTLLALAESIRAGTTCVADMYFHTDEIARAVEESGIRGLLSYGIVAQTPGQRVREELATARAVVERWQGAGNGRILTAISPHAVHSCVESAWQTAIETARDLGVPVHTHLSESTYEVDECRTKTGLSPVAYLDRLGVFSVPTIAAHCVHVDEGDITILAERGVCVVHCPKSNAKLGNGVAPIAAMRQAGIPVALGTDGAASNNRLDMVEELRAAWLIERAQSGNATRLSAREVVGMATEDGRQVLGMPPGGFIKGRVADVVLLDADRLHTVPPHNPAATVAYASSACDVTDVIVDGEFVMKSGELLTIDEEKVKSEVASLVRRYRN